MVGENSINLTTGANAAIGGGAGNDFNYRFVKLCEIIPFLYDLSYVSLTEGDFHI